MIGGGNLTNATSLANVTYVLDLDAIRAEHPPLLSILSARNQELIIAAGMTVAIIVGGMLFIDAALSDVANEMGERAFHVVSNIGDGAALAVRSLDRTVNGVSRSDIITGDNEAVPEAKT